MHNPFVTKAPLGPVARPWAFLALALLLLAGCGEAPPEPKVFERPISFAEPPWGILAGDRIDWHFKVHNAGGTRATGLNLHLAVGFNNGLGGDQAQKPVPDLAPGATQHIILSTPYHGQGDYSGRAEVRQGAFLATGQPVFFEYCGYC